MSVQRSLQSGSTVAKVDTVGFATTSYVHSVVDSIRRTPLSLLMIALILPSILLVAVVLQPWVRPSWLLRDALAVAVSVGIPADHTPFYYGLISNFGILLMCSMSAICLLTGSVLTYVDARNGYATFMIVSGLIGVMLMLDDFFMIHETIFNLVTGLDEIWLIGFYAFVLGSYLWFFRKVFPDFYLGLFVLALAGFGGSVLADLYGSDFEDGPKLFGIVAWTLFYVTTSWQLLTRTPPIAVR